MISDNLRHERETRLLQLLTIKAPLPVIADECRLILATYYGSHVRAIVGLTRKLIRFQYDWYLTGVQLWLHYVAERCGVHLPFNDETGECWACVARDNRAEMERVIGDAS